MLRLPPKRPVASQVKIWSVIGRVYLLTNALPTFKAPPGTNDVSRYVSNVLIAAATFLKLSLIVGRDPAILSEPRISVIVIVAI
jgi:hypothetical protein